MYSVLPRDTSRQVWKCQSSEARQKLCRMTLVSMHHGVLAWLYLAMLTLLCMVGLWGQHTTLTRPALTTHMERRHSARRREVQQLAQSLLDTFRREAAAGTQHLVAARDATEAARADIAERAFECFVIAIHALQGLKLGDGGTLASGLAELGLTEPQELHVGSGEQADVYCSWALSALLKYRCVGQHCGCRIVHIDSQDLCVPRVCELCKSVDSNGAPAAEPGVWVGGAGQRSAATAMAACGSKPGALLGLVLLCA